MIPAFLKRMMKGPEPEQPTSPSEESIGEVTALLRHFRTDEPDAQAELIARMYPELKRIAQGRMRSERSDHTLQPTALVNEFFLQMAKQQDFVWRNRSHFLAVASKAMQRLLIDYSRAHDAAKRGGGLPKLQLDDLMLPEHGNVYDIVEINDVLQRLSNEEPRMAQVVEMRCFGGLTNQEIAETLGIDERTVKRDWQVARAWLFGQLRKGLAHAGGTVGQD